MRLLTPHFFAFVALVAPTNSAKASTVPSPRAEIFPPQNEDTLLDRSTSPASRSGQRRNSTPILLALLAVTLATVLLLVHCFRIQQSNTKSAIFGVTRRTLLEGVVGPCIVGLGQY